MRKKKRKKHTKIITKIVLFSGILIGGGIGMNILVARNHESGNLEIGVPLLGNRLFCA